MDKEKTHEIWVQLFCALIVGNGGASLKYLADEADEAMKLAEKRCRPTSEELSEDLRG